MPWITKKDGRREPFSREKLLRGLALACRKRPIDASGLEALVQRVEDELVSLREPDVPAHRVGLAAMHALRDVDAVAYVRFASVYREFETVEHFVEALRPLQAMEDDTP